MRKLLALVGITLLGCGDDGAGAGAGAGAAGGSNNEGGAGVGGADAGGAPGGGGPPAAGGGGASVGGASPGCGDAETAGTFDETIDVGGVSRSYVLVIPAGLTGADPVPLVFGFHGFGGTGTGASQYFGLSGEGAVFAYPQALPLPDQNGGIGWDMTEDGVDVAFIDALVTKLESEHCIDGSRVFAAGHSHGASFSNHLGCYRPETFRAIAPVAGGGPWAGKCTGSVSALLTHGSADQDVPIDNGIGSREHWLEVNGCAGASSAPAEPSPCVAYAGCAEPVLWCEHSGGHEWPDFAGAGIRQFFLAF